MLTTRQLVDRLHLKACQEGLDYADAHPDPTEAIDFALACPPPRDEDEGEFYGSHPRVLLRWAASDPAVSGHEEGEVLCGQGYLDLGDWRAPDHAARCADLLRAWVREQVALEARRQVCEVQRAFEALCIGGEPIHVSPDVFFWGYPATLSDNEEANR